MRTQHALKLLHGASLKFELNDDLTDPLCESIRRGDNPCINNFLFLADRYGLPGAEGAILDAGANIGCCTFAFATMGHSVYAFEADPELCELLRHNTALNDLSCVHVYPVAVSSKSGTVRFSSGGAYGHIVNEDAQSGTEIPCIALDEWWIGVGRPRIAFIKLDIEGAEVDALRGARRVIAENDHPTLMVEVNGHCLNWFGHTADELISCAASDGYLPFRMEPGGLRPTSPNEVEPYTNVDFLFVHPSKLSTFSRHVLPPLSFADMREILRKELKHENPHHRQSAARSLSRFPHFMDAEMEAEVKGYSSN